MSSETSLISSRSLRWYLYSLQAEEMPLCAFLIHLKNVHLGLLINKMRIINYTKLNMQKQLRVKGVKF